MAEKVRVNIKSTAIDTVLAEKYMAGEDDGFFTDDDGNRHPLSDVTDICSEKTEFTLEGELSEEDGTVTVTYREGEEIGYENCFTSLIVSEGNRSKVTMVRSGDISTACLFDPEEPRQLCCYSMDIMPLEFTVCTRKVHTTLGRQGGAILLDYNIEIRGMITQRNRLFIDIRPI